MNASCGLSGFVGNAINTFKHKVTTLLWIRTLWFDFSSRMTSFIHFRVDYVLWVSRIFPDRIVPKGTRFGAMGANITNQHHQTAYNDFSAQEKLFFGASLCQRLYLWGGGKWWPCYWEGKKKQFLVFQINIWHNRCFCCQHYLLNVCCCCSSVRGLKDIL